jgi:hypothetical protein
MISQQSSIRNRGIANTWSSLSKLSFNSYGKGGSDRSSAGASVPTLRDDKCYPDYKDHRTQGMTVEDVQHFWSTLSIHAASTAMDIGGGTKSAVAAAESLLEHNEEVVITSQTIRNAASKASISILKNNSADSRIASAVAVAVIQRGTSLLKEMNEQNLHETQAKSSQKVVSERSSTHHISSRKSLRSRTSRNSSRDRKNNVTIHNFKQISESEIQKNPLDDNITVGSISTVGFENGDKYSTEMETESERGRNFEHSSSLNTRELDKYATNLGQIDARCSSDESSHASEEPSQYSTDHSTIATESYHGLGERYSRHTRDSTQIPKFFRTTGGSSSSYSITKKVDSLAEFAANSSDISKMRRKEEELERKHAEFAAAADALEKKIAAAVAALESSGSASTSQSKLDNIATPRVSNRGRASSKKNKETDKLTNTTITEERTMDDELTTSPGGQQFNVQTVSGKASKLFSIAEDETENTGHYTSGSSYDNRCANFPSSINVLCIQNEGGEKEEGKDDDDEEPIEVVLGKKTLKGKVKEFVQNKTKKVTWGAKNAFKIIPARSTAAKKKSAERRLSMVLQRRRTSRRRFGCVSGMERSGRVITGQGPMPAQNPQTTINNKEVESKVATFGAKTLTTKEEIPFIDTCSTVTTLDISQASSKSSRKNLSSRNNAMQFLNQAFYSQPDQSIDEETVVTFSTNGSAQSSVEAVLEVDSFVTQKDGEDLSRSTDASSYYSRISRSTIGSGSNLGLRFA